MSVSSDDLMGLEGGIPATLVTRKTMQIISDGRVRSKREQRLIGAYLTNDPMAHSRLSR
jgi:hypothetical protein